MAPQRNDKRKSTKQAWLKLCQAHFEIDDEARFFFFSWIDLVDENNNSQ